MARPIIFGQIENIKEGYLFEGRKEMMPTSFHRNWASGIDGNGTEGTSAIVLSGGYEDDEDLGDLIIYTGAGGNDSNTGKQIEDQNWLHHGNAGLLKSMNEGLPIRVIRGFNHKSKFSPKSGYLYAGLYSVVDAWEKIGKSGFKICQFRLEYCGEDNKRKIPEEIELDYTKREIKRKQGVIIRRIRDTKIAHDVKKLYNYECQICKFTIITKSGNYSEGAHIKPLGIPHDGDDNPDNLLCLCPNHHTMFDKGCFSISDDLNLIGQELGTLYVHASHKLNISNLKYHRISHGFK
jgi:putative restriction endonuclease